MFVRAGDSSGDHEGVFEYVDGTGYRYLHIDGPGGWRVVGAIHILSGPPGFAEADVDVRWSVDERIVGLFICNRLWAAFRGREPFGGKYVSGGKPEIPGSILTAFETGR